MSSKYDKSIQISREEEGSYHRREVESTPSRPPKVYTTESYEVLPAKPSGCGGGGGGGTGKQVSSHYKGYTSDEDNYDEWTTSKRKVNHKTRQVETRVSRQLLVEDGKVIADSGPQVTTRIKEDNKVEECEKEKAPKNRGRFEALEGAPEGPDSQGRVLGEKKEIQRVTREVREENMQYHDERFKELTGPEVHRSATRAPHELITIHDQKSGSGPRGKMVHYSQKGKKTRDTDEILEVAKLAIDGSITKEVKRTRHHEECSEDEKPDETGEAEALKREPIATRSSRRGADYVNDFDDTSSCPSDHEAGAKTSSARHHSAGRGRHSHQHQDEAFPRYQLEPLLNSLRDEDFVVRQEPNAQHHRLERRQRDHSSDDDDDDDDHSRDHHRYQRQQYSKQQPPPRPVEIPEAYRVHRQQHRGPSTRIQHEPVERSLSPAPIAARSQPKSHHRQHHREDASVQAHLSDEEEQQHERQARQLQRQSTGGSRRNYYYGDQRRPKSPAAASSASSSDLSDPKEQMRRGKSQQATSGRDSGFKSPHSHRQAATPISMGDEQDEQQQIYSVSSKAARRERMGAASPAPSAGQRSVKTSVTTVSAGLEDSRPPRRPQRAGGKQQEKAFYLTQSHFNGTPPRTGAASLEQRTRRGVVNTSNHYQFDYDPATASASIVGVPGDGLRERRPSASSMASRTTIKVPYCRQPVDEAQFEGSVRPVKEMAGSEMGFEQDIKQLRRRLADIEAGQQQQQQNYNYNYKTVVGQVQPQQQLVGAYNVRIVQQQNPFEAGKDESVARLEDLSNELSSSLQLTNNASSNNNNNNNEPGFNLNDYTKHKAVPARVDSTGDSLVAADDFDGLSLVSSSCSLRSSRTYHIRSDELPPSAKASSDDKQCEPEEDLDDERDFPVVSSQVEKQPLDLDELERDKSRPAAWIFDPRDGSSTAIVAPPKPEKPAPAQVDSKELAEARGGQSYYLEVHNPPAKPSVGGQPAKRAPRPTSIDSLYSRWNSQGTLVSRKDDRKQQQQRRPAQASVGLQSAGASRPNLSSSGQQLEKGNSSNPLSAQRRQLPFMGSQLSNRSKSSSCLASFTKPSKYSIYGGLRGDNKKPVPRLSYSRAIGPKSQRPLGDQKQQQQPPTKTASRYLKMK